MKTYYTVLLSDSKALTLKKHCPRNCFPVQDSWYIVGGQTEKLVDLAIRKIRPTVRRHGKTLIYIWTGTCDITEKEENDHDIHLRYEEGSKSLSVVSKQYRRLINYISDIPEVTLKFIEIPYISTKDWNVHTETASCILTDKSIETQVRSINLHIRELNREIGQNTLYFAAVCINCRKSKGKQSRYSINYKVLEDGVHPNQKTSLIWLRKLQRDVLTHCCEDPDILDLTVLSDDLNLLE